MPGRWGCPACGTVYADRLFGGCPRHPGTPLGPQQEEDGMAKITKAGGPSNPDAEPGQPGYVEPETDTPEAGGEPARRGNRAAKQRDGADTSEQDEGGERSSRGSSSRASTETPPSAPKTNDDADRSPAPTTENPSGKDPEAGSTARSTAGAKTGRAGK